jgi:hypothetical protein
MVHSHCDVNHAVDGSDIVKQLGLQ